jgi:hypothetical protein
MSTGISEHKSAHYPRTSEEQLLFKARSGNRHALLPELPVVNVRFRGRSGAAMMPAGRHSWPSPFCARNDFVWGSGCGLLFFRCR